jgi:hypothetical protein
MSTERVFREWCWCCCWQTCGGIGDPGYTGGGVPELCTACEEKRLKAIPQPLQDETHEPDDRTEPAPRT